MLSIASCDEQIVRTEAVEVPGPVQYVPIPRRWTKPTPSAPIPAGECRNERGEVVLCNEQLPDVIDACEVQLAQCNADKAMTRCLGDKATTTAERDCSE